MDIKIKDEIKRIRDTFGPIRERDSRSVPFTRLIRLFDAMKKHLNNATRDKITLRMLSIAEKIKKMMGTLLKKIEANIIGNVSYAQTTHQGAAVPIIKHLQPVKPPKENPIKEKQLLIRMIDVIEAEIIHKLSIRALIERITVNIGDEQRISGVIIVYQLLNKDVQIYLMS